MLLLFSNLLARVDTLESLFFSLGLPSEIREGECVINLEGAWSMGLIGGVARGGGCVCGGEGSEFEGRELGFDACGIANLAGGAKGGTTSGCRDEVGSGVSSKRSKAATSRFHARISSSSNWQLFPLESRDVSALWSLELSSKELAVVESILCK